MCTRLVEDVGAASAWVVGSAVALREVPCDAWILAFAVA